MRVPCYSSLVIQADWLNFSWEEMKDDVLSDPTLEVDCLTGR